MKPNSKPDTSYKLWIKVWRAVFFQFKKWNIVNFWLKIMLFKKAPQNPNKFFFMDYNQAKHDFLTASFFFKNWNVKKIQFKIWRVVKLLLRKLILNFLQVLVGWSFLLPSINLFEYEFEKGKKPFCEGVP